MRHPPSWSARTVVLQMLLSQSERILIEGEHGVLFP